MCIRDRRKGLGIGGNKGPWFVVGKDVHKNILYVTNGNEKDWLYSTSCIVSGVNWLRPHKPENEYACTAKFRYRQQDHEISLQFIDETTVLVCYPQGVASVTCGQEAVFYDGQECLGGGVIEEVFCDGISMQKKIEEHVAHGKN